jgi:hypothetical protein
MTKTLDGAERSHRLDVDSYAGVWRFDPERSSVRFQVGFSCEGYDPPDGGGDIARRHQRNPPNTWRRPRLRSGLLLLDGFGLRITSATFDRSAAAQEPFPTATPPTPEPVLPGA